MVVCSSSSWAKARAERRGPNGREHTAKTASTGGRTRIGPFGERLVENHYHHNPLPLYSPLALVSTARPGHHFGQALAPSLSFGNAQRGSPMAYLPLRTVAVPEA